MRGQSLLKPGVSEHGVVEPLAMHENVQGEGHLHTLPLLLDLEQSSLQVEPEGDLLQGRTTAGVPDRLGHLLDLPDPLVHLQTQKSIIET